MYKQAGKWCHSLQVGSVLMNIIMLFGLSRGDGPTPMFSALVVRIPRRIDLVYIYFFFIILSHIRSRVLLDVISNFTFSFLFHDVTNKNRIFYHIGLKKYLHPKFIKESKGWK